MITDLGNVFVVEVDGVVGALELEVGIRGQLDDAAFFQPDLTCRFPIVVCKFY